MPNEALLLISRLHSQMGCSSMATPFHQGFRLLWIHAPGVSYQKTDEPVAMVDNFLTRWITTLLSEADWELRFRTHQAAPGNQAKDCFQ